MTGAAFFALGRALQRDKIEPLQQQVARLKADLKKLDAQLEGYRRFKEVHGFLVNGETPAGMFGMSPTFAFLVAKYAAEGLLGKVMTVKDVELLIVPGVLVPHSLRVSIPDPTRPGVSTNTSREVDVPGIVERMKEYTGNAANVREGAMADVHRESCKQCGQPALVVACDELIDDDSGRVLTLSRLCPSCWHVDAFANYGETDALGYDSRTAGIYRKQ